MTKGDKLFGIKTVYKGIEMRSKLETKVAMFLDALGIEWQYEPKRFLLSNGTTYIPDFYLPKHDMWLEVKGLIGKHNELISEKFVEENNTELIMFSSIEMRWFSTKDYVNELCKDRDIQIGKCGECKNIFFCSNLGSYYCRCCGYHDGDHDIFGKMNSFGLVEIDFSDIESIKRWLNENKVRI